MNAEKTERHPADVIWEEAERYRNMSSEERMQEFDRVLNEGYREYVNSPRKAEIDAEKLESERLWREAVQKTIQQWIARHGPIVEDQDAKSKCKGSTRRKRDRRMRTIFGLK